MCKGRNIPNPSSPGFGIPAPIAKPKYNANNAGWKKELPPHYNDIIHHPSGNCNIYFISSVMRIYYELFPANQLKIEKVFDKRYAQLYTTFYL